MFKDVKFMSAKQKEMPGRTSKNNRQERYFTSKKPLYEHLHVHCGFIAHYNIHGFRKNTPARISEDLLSTSIKPLLQSTTLFKLSLVGERDYADINTQIADYVTAQAQQIYGELDEAQKM